MPVYKSCLELLKDPLLADNPYLLNLKIVYEVAITYYLAELDNAAIFHADFTRRSDNLYRRTLLLQCYRVFSEATKALFGFGKDQRNALWGKLTSTIDLSSFSTELEEISAGVERLLAPSSRSHTPDPPSSHPSDETEAEHPQSERSPSYIATP